LAQHIAIAYLRGNEVLAENGKDGKPSLFWKILHNADSSEVANRWLAVASYFWSISPRTLEKSIRDEDGDEEELGAEITNRIINFWRWTYDNRNKVEGLLKDDYKQFLARMADLTIYLDKIDNEKESWLLLVAPHCNLHHMSSFFIEYLTRFLNDDESVERVGRIFLKILEGTTPDFNKDHIYEVVRRLYELKDKNPRAKGIADEICNTYGQRNQYFLKTLFSENQLFS
jgi:hypothetical protein